MGFSARPCCSSPGLRGKRSAMAPSEHSRGVASGPCRHSPATSCPRRGQGRGRERERGMGRSHGGLEGCSCQGFGLGFLFLYYSVFSLRWKGKVRSGDERRGEDMYRNGQMSTRNSCSPLRFLSGWRDGERPAGYSRLERRSFDSIRSKTAAPAR